jgi:hypothetical protein
MGRFSCPCGLEADVDPAEMLDFVNSHSCAYHKAAPAPAKSTGTAWAGVAESALLVLLLLGLCVACGWLVKA